MSRIIARGTERGIIMKKVVIILVEHGWRAHRQCSIVLNERRIGSVSLIKGWLATDLLEEIAPYTHIRLLALSRKMYRVFACSIILLLAVSGRLRAVIVDNKKNAQLMQSITKFFRKKVFIIRETTYGFLILRGDAEISGETFFEELER